MKTIVTTLALAAIFGLAAPSTSQAEDAHHGNGHYPSHGQSSYGHGGYQPGHSGYNQHGYQSGHGHAPSHPSYGHGSYQPSYGHGGYQSGYGHGGYGHPGYQSSYGHAPSHRGGHISLPGIHLSFGGHSSRH